MLHDKNSNEEYWIFVDENQNELRCPKVLTPGHEYFVQLHVAKVLQDGHKICQPMLTTSFKAGRISDFLD